MIAMRPTYVAVVSVWARACDIVAAAAAIPSTTIMIIWSVADMNGAVAMRKGCKCGTA